MYGGEDIEGDQREAGRSIGHPHGRIPENRSRKDLVGAFVFHEIVNNRKRGSGIRKWLQGVLPGLLREIG